MWLEVHYLSASNRARFLRKESVTGSPGVSQHLALDWTLPFAFTLHSYLASVWMKCAPPHSRHHFEGGEWFGGG